MRDQERDQELQGLFQNLQEEDRQRAPDFGTLMARALEEASRSGAKIQPGKRTARRIHRRLAWGGSLLAAAAAAVLLLVQLPSTSDSDFERVVRAFSADPASGAWESPTDALLDLPGTEILSTVPSIDTGRWPMGPSPDPRRNEL